MGLKYYYDKFVEKWAAQGLFFRKEYDTEEEMLKDAHDAQEDYFKRLGSFRAFAESMVSLW